MADILIVDDDRQNLELLRLLLESEGIEAHCASSGAEALRKITERAFCMMITDLNMPGLNGLELSQKALLIAPYMVIVMCTGDITPELPFLASEIGIMKVLAKPLSLDEILEMVREVVENDGKRALTIW
jgi:DNA-binding NtrC family response regulator